MEAVIISRAIRDYKVDVIFVEWPSRDAFELQDDHYWSREAGILLMSIHSWSTWKWLGAKHKILPGCTPGCFYMVAKFQHCVA